MKDVIFFVADGNMERLFEGLLPRIPTASSTNEFSYDIIVNQTHDAGCLNDSHEYLRPFIRQYRYAVVIFDHEGCGEEEKSAIELEQRVETFLNNSGWEGRNMGGIIDPELENWIWIDSPHVPNSVNWKSSTDIFSWIQQNGFTLNSNGKPERPKESFEAVLRNARSPRSSAIYKKIASKVSYKRCIDRAFLKLVETLKTWFPPPLN